MRPHTAWRCRGLQSPIGTSDNLEPREWITESLSNFGYSDRCTSIGMLYRLKCCPLRSKDRDPGSPALAAAKSNFDPHAVCLDNARLALVIPCSALNVASLQTNVSWTLATIGARHRERSRLQRAQRSRS